MQLAGIVAGFSARRAASIGMRRTAQIEPRRVRLRQLEVPHCGRFTRRGGAQREVHHAAQELLPRVVATRRDCRRQLGRFLE
jgi:hypothetical protein